MRNPAVGRVVVALVLLYRGCQAVRRSVLCHSCAGKKRMNGARGTEFWIKEGVVSRLKSADEMKPVDDRT